MALCFDCAKLQQTTRLNKIIGVRFLRSLTSFYSTLPPSAFAFLPRTAGGGSRAGGSSSGFVSSIVCSQSRNLPGLYGLPCLRSRGDLTKIRPREKARPLPFRCAVLLVAAPDVAAPLSPSDTTAQACVHSLWTLWTSTPIIKKTHW